MSFTQSYPSNPVADFKPWFGKVSVVVAALIITACGGGGGGGKNQNPGRLTPIVVSDTWKMGVFNKASDYANKCEMPRTGIDPATNSVYADKKGSVKDENNFLRSWSNDTYLWYSEIEDINPANYSDPLQYFELLKTEAVTPSGVEKDQFHFTSDSAEWYAVSETGVSAGYGFELSWISNTPPRTAVIAYTEPGSPAANADIFRGAKIIKVDGYDFVNGNDATTIIKLNEVYSLLH